MSTRLSQIACGVSSSIKRFSLMNYWFYRMIGFGRGSLRLHVDKIPALGPSRRTFLKLISHPTYAPLAPYKLMAVELDLVPVSSGAVVPDLRWLVAGGFAIVFLLVGWMRLALFG